MGQREVLAWLSENPGWHPTAEVEAALGLSHKGVQNALSRAAMWRDIESKMVGFRKLWRIA
jgi:hypothetical protein